MKVLVKQMEIIKIAHLYYDLMNLYGEHGNVLGLTKGLEEHGVKVITHYYSVGEEIPLKDYDLIYIGSGNRQDFELALQDLMKRKEELKSFYESNKFFLITGNAIDFFGKCYHRLDNTEMETLGFFDYEAYETDFRIVGEQVYSLEGIDEVIGFENRNSVLKRVNEKPLFQVKQGTGYAPNSTSEGIFMNHFIGTYLLGPILIRNPHFKEYIISLLLSYKKIPYKEYINELELKAYQEYRKNLLNETEKS